MLRPDHDLVVHGDNLGVLQRFEPGSFRLVYLDPPFNTGREQRRDRLSTTASADGDRTGFGGRRYATTRLGSAAFADAFDDYLGFLGPRLCELHRLLDAQGTLYLH